LKDTVADLKSRDLDVRKVPYVRVVYDPLIEAYWCLDNRRLWCFKEARIRRVPVRIVGRARGVLAQYRRNGGLDVRLRGEYNHDSSPSCASSSDDDD